VDLEMMTRGLWRRVVHWEYFFMLLVIIATLAVHFAVIRQPPQQMFDEQHYVPDAVSIFQGNGTNRGEHPPLGKLLFAANISLFQDITDPLSFRLFPVLFGTLSIVLFYLICRRLNLSRAAASLAVFLFGFENLTFVQAGIAMLDVFMVTFMLLCFWLYLRGNYALSGLGGALAALAKLPGVLALGVIVLHWIFTRRTRPVYFIAGLVFSAAAFVGLLSVFNYPIYHELINPLENIQTMFSRMSSLTFENANHPAMSRPWEWIYLPLVMAYWLTPHYEGAISFNIWALIIPSMGYMIWRIWKRKDLDAPVFALSWFAATYLVWIPVVLVSNRVTYIYYFYPAVGAVCLAIAIGLASAWDLRYTIRGKVRHAATWSVIGYLTLHLVVFGILGPFYSW
jgi:dolichyl-phosphate-mannose-protein mannosyltransferase